MDKLPPHPHTFQSLCKASLSLGSPVRKWPDLLAFVMNTEWQKQLS